MRATLGRCPSGSLRQRLLVWTVAMMVITAVSGQTSGDEVQLFFKSPSCKYHNTTQELVCDLTNQTKRDAELAEAEWDDIRTTYIIGAKSLIIKPQSKADSKELHVTNCQQVNTEYSNNNNRLRLHLNQSSAETITNVANLLRTQSSKIKTVDLDPVAQFDFTDSEVHDLAVRATETKCSITRSDIHLIRSVVLEGNFKFQVDDSHITDIKYLHYNSSYKDSTITNVMINNVQESGIVISKGLIRLENVTIDNLDSKAIRIEDTGELRVQRSKITHAGVDSLIMNGGTIHFSEVTIGNQGNVSFMISGAAGGLQPFAIVFRRTSILKWILIGVVVGLILGVIICGLLYLFIMYRKGSLKSDDHEGMELLANNTTMSAKPSPSKQQQQQQQQKDKDKEEDELYEEYIDVDVDGAPPPPKDINLLSSRANPPQSTTQPPGQPQQQQQQGKNEDEEELYEEYVDVDVGGVPPPLSNITNPSPSTNHRHPPNNQSPPTTTAPPLSKNLPPLLSNPNLPNLSSVGTTPTSPHTGLALHKKPPATRAPPPPPQRKESMKNKLSSPSSSFSDERDDVGTISKSAKPQVPPGKPSFLHTVREDSKPSSTPVANPGFPRGLDFQGRPPLPGKPAPPPASQKASTFSTEDEEDIYDTLEDH